MNDILTSCIERDIKSFAFLVENGADIKMHDNLLLKYVSKEGCFEFIKFLIEKGVDIHANDDYALRWASNNGYLPIIKFLFEKFSFLLEIQRMKFPCFFDFICDIAEILRCFDDCAINRVFHNQVRPFG